MPTTPPPLTDQQHAAIRQRAHGATGGTWYLQPAHGTNFVASEHHGYEHGIGDLDFGTGDQADADREFVLNAHNDATALLVEVDRLRAERDQARAELARRRTEDLTLRGILAPADSPRRVPMPLGDSLAPAVEWLIAELGQARAQLAAVLALQDISPDAMELMDPEQYHQAIGYNDGLAASTHAINDTAAGES